MARSTPWAILLTKWKNNNVEPKPRAFFEELFTTAGTGSFNMTDYFDTMSHGSLDLSGSTVFGWFTLDQDQTAYVGNAAPGPGQLGRIDLVNAAKTKAQAGGVDLSKFFGVVVCMNTLTDLFGVQGGGAAVCDPGSFEPTVLGQEMGHGYGLQHSRLDGSTADYQDPWDTMSTWDSCYYASDPNYTLIGPGLNAANMRNMSWLDESRVWKPSSPAFSQQIELRPLHAQGLPGNLAAEVPGTPGGFLVEFRVAEDWDVAIPRAAVFVHRLDNGTSYRMLGSSSRSDLVVGDTFTAGVDLPWSSYTTVHVDEINVRQHYAKATLAYRPREIIRILDLVGEIFGGVAVDGGGVIWIGGKPHPVDPWGPLKEVTKQLVVHETAREIADPLGRLTVRRSALARIVETASAALEELEALETPPPRTRKATVPRAAQTRRASKAPATRSASRKKPAPG
jgi:hypothetical protein